MRLDRPARAFGWYLALTLAYTWPLPLELSTAVASDLGDPLLNAWILAWNGERFLDLLRGDLAGFARMWHANILHPNPYVLAYSELLHAQGLQALPLWALTRNPLLSYNLLLISTFVLSGLGMYVFVRELTGDHRAAFIAGLAFAFMPYRVDQLSHLQTLSSQWMPFALYGFRRYFVTRRPWPLAGAALALVAQYLSCGYFLFLFSIVVPLYVLWEMWTRGLLTNPSVWRDLTLTALVVVAVTVPVMYPYLALRDLHSFRRTALELRLFSGDLLGFLTAPESAAAWSWLQIQPKPEGRIFMGVVAPLLALIAIGHGLRQALKGTEVLPKGAAPEVSGHTGRRLLLAMSLLVGAFAGVLLFVYAISGPVSLWVGPVRLRMGSPVRAVVLLAASLTLVWWLSPSLLRRALAHITTLGRQPALPFGLLALVMAWLALGPVLVAAGIPRGEGTLYSWLYRWVPGFDGLRVPSRSVMVAGCFLAVTSGFGAAALLRRVNPRWWLLPLLSIAVLTDGWIRPPFPLDGTWPPEPGLAAPPARVLTGRSTPEVYLAAARLPAGSVLVELPFGDSGWDYQATFYSTVHWHRLLNGASGYVPREYRVWAPSLAHPADDPIRARRILARAGVTHVILHRSAYSHEEAARILEWLRTSGGKQVWTDGHADLIEIPAAPDTDRARDAGSHRQ